MQLILLHSVRVLSLLHAETGEYLTEALLYCFCVKRPLVYDTQLLFYSTGTLISVSVDRLNVLFLVNVFMWTNVLSKFTPVANVGLMNDLSICSPNVRLSRRSLSEYSTCVFCVWCSCLAMMTVRAWDLVGVHVLQ